MSPVPCCEAPAPVEQIARQREENLKRMLGQAGASGATTGTAAQDAAPSRSYAGRLVAHIKPNIVFTDTVSGNPAAEVEVRAAPSGTIVARRIAIAMNGEPLPARHGYPVRMVVPGLYGYVGATKWLTQLTVTTYAKDVAYWTQRGWAPRGPVKPSSRIDTPQNVAIEYNVATIVSRGLASLLDWTVLAGYTILFFQVLDLLDIGTGSLPEWFFILVLGIPWTFYNLLFEIFMDGRSIGKRTMNIKVARLDGGQPGLGHYLMRWILRPVDAIAFLGAAFGIAYWGWGLDRKSVV